jgi:nucleoside-diphosphate-sugar epimerase
LVYPQKPAALIEGVREADIERIQKIKAVNTVENRKIEVGNQRKENKVLVTGSTGLVGSNLIYELINKGYEVFALARPKAKETPEERIAQALRIINPDFDTSLEDAGIKVLQGDMLKENLGLNQEQIEQLKEIESVFNMAANVSFSEEKRKLIMAVNYDGVRNLINLLYKIGNPHLHHGSTAYIFGDLAEQAREPGTDVPIFKETDLDVGQKFRNPYEESKFRAEQLLASEPYLIKTIYRLGIIIGDSETYQTNAFNAFYGFWRVFDIIKRSLERKMRSIERQNYYKEFDIKFEGQVLHLPIQIPGEPNATANLVPIDWVVKTIVALSESPVVRKKNYTFHITHNNPPIYSQIIKSGLETLGIKKVEVNPRATMQFLTKYPFEESQKSEDPRVKIMGQILKGVSDYIPYIYGESRLDTFDRDEIQPNLERAPEISPQFIEKALQYALDRRFKPKP